MKRIISLALCGLLISAGSTALALTPLSPVARLAAKKVSQAPTDSAVSVYVHVAPKQLDRAALAEAGAKVSLDLGKMLTVRLPYSSLDKLSSIAGVEYVETPSKAYGMLDIARDETGAGAVIAGEGLDQPYTGRGVIIGIVDNGFDYTHGTFRDDAGNLRISRVWEQGSRPTSTQSSPEKFGYGVEMTNPDDILEAGGDIRSNSHGTHVASIAAGSDSRLNGILRGMAPEAEIVLVSMTDAGQNNVSISDAIAYIFDYADQKDCPCVINLSLGNHSGPHDGTSTFDMIADQLQGPGRLIIGSSGNHRADKFHVTKTFADASSDPLAVFAEFENNKYSGSFEVWSSADAEVNLLAVKLSTGDVVDRIAVYPTTETTVKVGSNIAGTLDVESEIYPMNNKIHVLLSSNITSIRNGYALAIEVLPKSAGTADIWADNLNIGLTDNDMPGYASTEGASTICEIGGTANRILTVGAYVTRADYTILGETTPRHLDENDGDLGSFSSCGPTADGRVKPQITAPGCFISAAVSEFDNSGTIILSRYFTDNEDSYGYMQGTSMSSPMVAGIVATWLEAYPDLTPEVLVDVISKTSRTDEYTETIPAGGNSHWGYGKIDAMQGLLKCIEYAKYGGINTISTETEPVSDKAVYDLRGIRVAEDESAISGLAPGLYISAGKKLIVR